jgi:hypothetical protein
MPPSSTVDRLLDEIRRDVVRPVRYSRRSMSDRCAPIALTTVLAVLTILSGMLLGGAAEQER